MNKKDMKRRARYYSKNLSNFRNVCRDTKNAIIKIDRWDYNCMGYAIGTYEWELLKSFRWTPYCRGIHHDEELNMEYMNDILWDCVDEILEKFPQLRLIKRPKELKANEHAVAFRIGETDFHWARLGSDGIWTHKPGNSTIREMSEEEFCGEWCADLRDDPYISDTIFFAVAAQKGRKNYVKKKLYKLRVPQPRCATMPAYRIPVYPRTRYSMPLLGTRSAKVRPVRAD